MREILFRGKSKGKPEWVYGSLYKEGSQVFILVGGRFYPEPSNGQSALGIMDWYEVFPDSIGQFTGLTDKNGQKIFEGDIVRFIWWWFDGAERESELTGTIVYSSDNMSFQLKGVKNKEWRDFVGVDEHDMDYLTPFSELNFCDADFEIIGNIHDNPELLS